MPDRIALIGAQSRAQGSVRTRASIGPARRSVLAALAGAAVVTVVLAAIAIISYLLGGSEGYAVGRPYVPRDPSLRDVGLYFYPATVGRRPRAFIFFFGNDVGFWSAHRELAASLASQGFSVAGFDMRALLASLPDPPALRDSAFCAHVGPLILSARRELVDVDGGRVPLVIAGHSLGAEVALWTAAYCAPPDLGGVLAMSPGARSHLRVSLSDIFMGPDPTGPSSFSVADATHAVASGRAGVRVAIIRGQQDHLRVADAGLLAAGGENVRRFIVPFAGHSLRGLTLERLVVREALSWILAGPTRQAVASATRCAHCAGPVSTEVDRTGGST